MSLSFHELLELNGRQPVLNNFFKFFDHEGETYGYMNRMPFRISFMQISPALKNIIKQLDGTKTLNEIVVSNSLDASFFDLVKVLYRNSVLRDKYKEVKTPEPRAMNLTFYPTTTCNLRCIYCYASAGDNPPVNLDIKKAETWINYVFENKPESVKHVKVSFHGGGEPTNAFPLMKLLWDQIKSRCLKEDLKVSLASISNGNFNDAVLQWFLKEKAFVYFSIDGVGEFHDLLRPRADGKGSFDLACRNMKKIKEAGLKTGIRCTVTATNKNHLSGLVDFVCDNKLDFLHLGQFSEYGRSEKNSSMLAITDEEFTAAYLETWKYALEKGVNMTGYPCLAISPGKEVFCSTFSPTSFALTPEGYLSHCPEVSLMSDSVAEVFISGKVTTEGKIEFYKDRIEKLKQRKPANISECRDCFLEYTCNSGCSVKSFRKNPDLLKVDEDSCDSLKKLSVELLRTVLDKHEKISEQREIEFLKYSHSNGTQIYAEYAGFNPLTIR